ncbi:carboxypeptidase-like regulatory domain-containing protein [Gillisia sp. Q332]|uniref:carboxypeptidase-like regulatory domain-containing protein n=1 Tax=Gillisia xinjiangensis TaxID=3384765 RepID=UPI0039198035
MIKKILCTLILLLAFPVFSQQENTLLKGTIKAPLLESASVHVINKTQKTGTVNSASGNFQLLVKTGDTLLFSSIQYQKLEVIISAEINQEGNLSIKLKEDINQLAEVNISNIQLTGNINTDLNNIEVVKDLPLDLRFGDIKHMVFESDVNDPLEAPKNMAFESNQVLQPGVNILGMADIISELLNIKKKGKPPIYKRPTTTIAAQMRKLFEDDFFKSSLGIKEEHINDFLFYVDENGLTAQMMEEKNRLSLLDFLFEQSKKYQQIRGRN